jgi:hypothetical protein
MTKELTTEQRTSRREYRQQWRERNREKVRAYAVAWHEEHPGKRNEYSKKSYDRDPVSESERKKKYRRENPKHLRALSIKRRYGITIDDYDRMVEKQSGKCAICGKEDSKLHIDHDHQTNRVRGLLCGPCNRKLHSVETESFLSRALAYLRQVDE